VRGSVGLHVGMVLGSTREWETILRSGDGELGGIVGGSVGLYVGVVMGSGGSEGYM
jgi:hypothetical protein